MSVEPESIDVELQALARALAAWEVSDQSAALNAVRVAESGLARKAPGTAEHIQARFLLAQLISQTGSISYAVTLYEEALGDAERLRDTEWVVMLRAQLSLALEDGLGLYDPALACACAGYEAAEAGGLDAGVVRSLVRMMLVYARIGEAMHAERLGLLALSLARDRNDTDEIRRCLLNLAVACNCVGDAVGLQSAAAEEWHQRALNYARRSHHIAQTLARPLAQATSMQTLGTALVRSGRYAEAESTIGQTMVLARAHKLLRVEIAAQRDLADCLMRQDRIQEAYDVLATANRDAELSTNSRNQRLIAKMLCDCCKRLGRFEEAIVHYDRFTALDLREESMRASARVKMANSQMQVDTARGIVVRVSESPKARQSASAMQVWVAKDLPPPTAPVPLA